MNELLAAFVALKSHKIKLVYEVGKWCQYAYLIRMFSRMQRHMSDQCALLRELLATHLTLMRTDAVVHSNVNIQRCL